MVEVKDPKGKTLFVGRNNVMDCFDITLTLLFVAHHNSILPAVEILSSLLAIEKVYSLLEYIIISCPCERVAGRNTVIAMGLAIRSGFTPIPCLVWLHL